MRRKTLSLISLFTLGLVLIGCNRGCTTAKTIASESTTLNTSAGNVEVVGRVVDYRHSRRIGNDVFNRSVSHTYGLTFDLKFGNFVQDEFFHEGVDDPKNVSLTKELKRVKIVISKDQKHIGLGVDDKVVDLIHLYKSNRISTQKEELIADGTMDWSKLDIESYPSPQSILTESLENSCGDIGFGKEAMVAFCDASLPSSTIHSTLLDQWPTCSFAKSYLTEKKVKQFSKDKKWREKAIERGRTVLNSKSTHGLDFDEIADFIVSLKSDELKNELDAMLVASWGESIFDDYSEVLLERVQSKDYPMDKEYRKMVYNDAQKGFAVFMKDGKSRGRFKPDRCLLLLNAMGDTTTGYNFVQQAFGPSFKEFDVSDFAEVAYDSDLTAFTEYQQRQIIQKTEKIFEFVEPRSRWVLFMRVQDVVDCSMLVRLKKRYPQDLKNSNLPFRCDRR